MDQNSSFPTYNFKVNLQCKCDGCHRKLDKKLGKGNWEMNEEGDVLKVSAASVAKIIENALKRKVTILLERDQPSQEGGGNNAATSSSHVLRQSQGNNNGVSSNATTRVVSAPHQSYHHLPRQTQDNNSNVAARASHHLSSLIPKMCGSSSSQSAIAPSMRSQRSQDHHLS